MKKMVGILVASVSLALLAACTHGTVVISENPEYRDHDRDRDHDRRPASDYECRGENCEYGGHRVSPGFYMK